MAINGINHVVLKVRSLEASDHFYRELLGFKKVGERGEMWFYSAGAHHHDLALVELGPNASTPRPGSTGLMHLCFNVPDEADLRATYRRLRDAGVAVSGGVDHVIMHSFYMNDPDLNIVEVGVDVPEEQWANVADPYAADGRVDLDH